MYFTEMQAMGKYDVICANEDRSYPRRIGFITEAKRAWLAERGPTIIGYFKTKMLAMNAIMSVYEKENAPRRIKIVCEVCGSEDVQRDARAHWNVEAQSWELHSVYDDDGFCEGCETERALKGWKYDSTNDSNLHTG